MNNKTPIFPRKSFLHYNLTIFFKLKVSSLMWMRTTMNYQYRYGTSTTEAMKHLWREGKIRRFYRGYGPALLQGPISRFGDTAANVGILALLESNTDLPIALKTGAASITAGLWRILIMPIDTVKTTLQVIKVLQTYRMKLLKSVVQRIVMCLKSIPLTISSSSILD